MVTVTLTCSPDTHGNTYHTGYYNCLWILESSNVKGKPNLLSCKINHFFNMVCENWRQIGEGRWHVYLQGQKIDTCVCVSICLQRIYMHLSVAVASWALLDVTIWGLKKRETRKCLYWCPVTQIEWVFTHTRSGYFHSLDYVYSSSWVTAGVGKESKISGTSITIHSWNQLKDRCKCAWLEQAVAHNIESPVREFKPCTGHGAYL